MSEQINNKIVDIIQAVLGDYASSCKVAPFDGQIMIEEDMGTAYSKLRNDLVESGKTSLLNINDYHGLTVQPKDTDGPFTILLNKKYILLSMENNNVDWLGTLVHEAVHVNDFKDYFNLVAASSYDELYEFSLHRIFLYWTEFHARAIGHYFLRKYTLVNFESQDHLEHLINEELPFQINYMVTHVGATMNADSQMYTIVHFLGRLAVWQHLYPDVFTSDFISELTNSNPWMEELYNWFVGYEKLEDIAPHFNEIESLLDEHFSEQNALS